MKKAPSRSGTLTLPKKFTELGSVNFKSPVKVDYFVDSSGIIYFTWDCGMEGVPVNPETPWCGIDKIKSVKRKLIRACQYDLSHAFFHYEGDPNYSHYHWALKYIYACNAELKELEY